MRIFILLGIFSCIGMSCKSMRENSELKKQENPISASRIKQSESIVNFEKVDFDKATEAKLKSSGHPVSNTCLKRVRVLSDKGPQDEFRFYFHSCKVIDFRQKAGLDSKSYLMFSLKDDGRGGENVVLNYGQAIDFVAGSLVKNKQITSNGVNTYTVNGLCDGKEIGGEFCRFVFSDGNSKNWMFNAYKGTNSMLIEVPGGIIAGARPFYFIRSNIKEAVFFKEPSPEDAQNNPSVCKIIFEKVDGPKIFNDGIQSKVAILFRFSPECSENWPKESKIAICSRPFEPVCEVVNDRSGVEGIAFNFDDDTVQTLTGDPYTVITGDVSATLWKRLKVEDE